MATTTLYASGGYLYEYYKTTNYASSFYVSKQTGAARRTILVFDVSSLAGKYVESAVLTIQNSSSGLYNQTVTCYKMTRNDYVYNQATWNIYKTGSSWTAAGGDYEASSPAPVTILIAPSTSINTWTITDIVQDAVDNTINCNLLIKADDETSPVDHFYGIISASNPKLDITYYDITAKSVTDSVSSVTETIAITTSTFSVEMANNNQGYILNRKTGYWTSQSSAPFTSAVYRPSTRKVLGARRDLGQIASFEGRDFAGTDIDSEIQTGYMNLGEFDEIKAMDDKSSEATKRLRAFFADCKGEGNLSLTIYTENDNTGETFTIPLATTDNETLNAVRIALSRSLRGKYISFKLTNASGNDFFIGETRIKVMPKAVR